MKTKNNIRLLVFAFLLVFLNINLEAEWQIYNTNTSLLPDNFVTGISIDGFGNIWAGSIECDIVKIVGNDMSVVIKDTLSLAGLNGFYADSKGYVWAGGSGGFVRISSDGKYLRKDASNSTFEGTIGSFFEMDSLRMMVGSQAGLYIVNRNDISIIEKFIYSNSIINSSVLAIAKDSSGTFWFGTGTGLVKYDGTNLTKYDTNNSGLKSATIQSIAIDHLGNKWMGTNTRGVYKYDGTNWTNYDIHLDSNEYLPIPIRTVFDIKIDTAGNIWFGGTGGVAKLSSSVWSEYTPLDSPLPHWAAGSLVIDKNNNKWIATHGGLAVFNEGGILYTTVQETNGTSIAPKSYPNPVNNKFNFEYTLEKNSNVNLSICDLNGRVLQVVIDNREEAGAKHVNIDISDLPAGSYYCILKVNGKIQMKKIIKRN